MKSIALTCTLFILTGCYSPPDINSIKAEFISERASFEALNTLIKEDSAGELCFAVGHEHIGEFWKSGDLWHKSSDYTRKIKLETVLKEVGLSEKRYVQYMELFKVTGSHRVSHCKEIGWSRIIMAASGLGISGCLTSININDNLSVPESDITESYSSEITPIVDGWYINHDCT